MCCTLAAAASTSRAAIASSEREWKPRRHYRRLGERFSDNWAQELVEEQDGQVEAKLAARKRQEQLRLEQEEAEAVRRRAEEAVRRKKAEAILAVQAEQSRNKSLPFSVKVGGREMAPFIIWGGLGLLALGALKGVVATATNAGKGKGQGKWVYDRSLGGKKVWVPADGTTASGSGAQISDQELERLAALAAAAAAGGGAKQAAAQPAVAELPTWWNPGPRLVPDPALRASRQQDAERLLARMEAGRNAGADFDLKDVVKLRECCQEGAVVARPRTVGARDALFRTAVDAAVAVATDPNESFTYIGDAPPTRFLASLATAIDMPAEKGVQMTCAAVAAATRARLLEALAGIREDDVASASTSSGSSAVAAARQGETAAVMSLVRLTSLLEKLPVLGGGSTEVALIAESLQSSFSVDERRRAFYLMGQLFPDAAALAASLLGFQPEAVVPQLMADMEAWRKQYEESLLPREGAA